MKIGILTYYGDLNCGTNLQAYATLLAVQRRHPDDHVEVIPFHGFRPPRKPYLSSATPISLLHDWRRMQQYSRFKRMHLGVTDAKVITDIDAALQFIKNRNYDVIYIGADTLLELDRLPQGSNDISAYWLSPDIKARKVLLAASCKNTEYNTLTKSQIEKLRASIEGFTAMGIRDITTYNLLSHFVDSKRIATIPDPTFSLPIDYSHIEQYLRKNNITIPKRSICFHTYRTDTWCKEVAHYFKTQGYTIVSLRPAPWADIALNGLSPLEQLGVYRYFSLIVTHRFHDTIFALKNGIAPLTYVSDSSYTTTLGNSKCSSLIEEFDLYPQHIIDNPSQLNAACFIQRIEAILASFDSHKEAIEHKLQSCAQAYTDFLNSCITD
ncbi:MAG: polysaccharide pyruvyl transferase family protein [Bacteroidaceae bacterium]|nr:polysaccharide pyruvyl transferase family protein [Bacteroidaceae bacterium]